MSPSEALQDLGQAIPPIDPAYIGFPAAAAALDHKANGAGGWVFVPDNAAGAVWFDGALFTAGAVMRHPAANGSGRLL